MAFHSTSSATRSLTLSTRWPARARVVVVRTRTSVPPPRPRRYGSPHRGGLAVVLDLQRGLPVSRAPRNRRSMPASRRQLLLRPGWVRSSRAEGEGVQDARGCPTTPRGAPLPGSRRRPGSRRARSARAAPGARTARSCGSDPARRSLGSAGPSAVCRAQAAGCGSATSRCRSRTSERANRPATYTIPTDTQPIVAMTR